MVTDAEIHAERSQEPNYWVNRASDLHASAGVIWYAIHNNANSQITESVGLGRGFDLMAGTWPVYLMLCGMSLELALKAVIVSHGESPRATHDLVQLADQAGVAVEQDQKGLLHFLSECVIWAGRYPVPKKSDDLEYFTYLHYENFFIREKRGNTTYLKPKQPYPLDWPQFQVLWNAIIEEVVPG